MKKLFVIIVFLPSFGGSLLAQSLIKTRMSENLTIPIQMDKGSILCMSENSSSFATDLRVFSRDLVTSTFSFTTGHTVLPKTFLRKENSMVIAFEQSAPPEYSRFETSLIEVGHAGETIGSPIVFSGHRFITKKLLDVNGSLFAFGSTDMAQAGLPNCGESLFLVKITDGQIEYERAINTTAKPFKPSSEQAGDMVFYQDNLVGVYSIVSLGKEAGRIAIFDPETGDILSHHDLGISGANIIAQVGDKIYVFGYSFVEDQKIFSLVEVVIGLDNNISSVVSTYFETPTFDPEEILVHDDRIVIVGSSGRVIPGGLQAVPIGRVLVLSLEDHSILASLDIPHLEDSPTQSVCLDVELSPEGVIEILTYVSRMDPYYDAYSIFYELIDIGTSVPLLEEKKVFSVYPNPSSGQVTVDVLEDVILDVYNIQGAVIDSRRFTKGKTVYQVKGSPGLYTMRDQQGHQSKIIIR